ncbi:MAG: FAD-dependent oxidoreductase [Armatimonadetes bacterium]|nr:FAD-dependent oxidoreductase [Armatimonadota bacterium]
MRTEAQAVIIGGGVAGCSIAYHLTLMGWREIVLLEKGQLTGGATFHAAGLIGQLRGSHNLTRMIMYSVELYARLREETGLDPDWRGVGSLRLAGSPRRMEELRRQAALAKAYGLELELIGPREAVRLFPIMSERDLVGAAYIPGDGRIDPSGLTYALAHAARSRGCEIQTQTPVTDIVVRDGRVQAVVTDRGTIRTPVAVCAAGIWSWQIGRMVGVTIPITPVEHQYLVTVPFEGVPRDLPVMRDPDLLVYFREEVGGLVVGGYERTPVSWGLDGIPPDFNLRLLPPNWERFEPLARNAAVRIPELNRAGIRKLINGPDGFTADGEFLLGEAPDVRGFFVAGGSPGIATGGGVGKVLAEWIIEGRPSLDLWRADVRRFGVHFGDRAYSAARALEVYSRNYTVHYPLEEFESARPLRVSPPYSRLQSLGAVFGEKGGWERPNWFASNEREDPPAGPEGWIRHNWSPAIAVEHAAAREAAGLFDFTSFSKCEVEGRGALGALQWLTDNDLDKPVGAVTYTQMLNAQGGIECDLTVTRLGPERFFVVTGSAFGVHDLDWIRRHLPTDGSVALREVTAALGCVGLWGPRAREILQEVSDDDLSNGTFPYMTYRAITVAGVAVRALRVTYVGELGWELYVPFDAGLRVWDALWEAGRPRGLRAVGYRAVDSLRLEKGYRYWSADITPEYTPYEAGLGFCVKIDRKDFQGREALLRQRAEGLTRKLCCLVLADPAAHPLGNEPVLADGRVVSRVTSGGYGFTVRESIAYAYLPVPLGEAGTVLAVEVDGRVLAATVQREPRFDPTNSRIRS